MMSMSISALVWFIAVEAILVIVGIVGSLLIDQLSATEYNRWFKLALWIIVGAAILVRLLAFVGIG